MHKSDISTEQPADQMQRELFPDSTEMSGALPPCSFLSVLLKLTLSCAFLGKLGKGSWLPSPLNFTSWQSSVPLRHPKHTHSYCHKWLAIILPHRMQSKPRFWSKPFITFKNHPLQFSFYFPFPLGHISVPSAGFFPYSTGIRRGAPCYGTRAPHTGQTHLHALSKIAMAGSWVSAGLETQPFWGRQP